MAETDFTKKITRAIKTVDKLVQDVVKDAHEIKASFTTLRDSFKGSEDKEKP